MQKNIQFPKRVPLKGLHKPHNPMRFASFFAGIGGFDLGLQKAGMEPVFHCEVDPHCQKILKRHWPKVPLHGDITTLTASQIPEAEIWCAGWPCQDLSQGNAFRAGLQGSRSGLFFTFAKLAEEIKPKWIILENVKGLLTADKGTAFEHVINTLEEIGYLGGWFTCNLLDIGLPQHRERVFIIASYKSDCAYKFYSHCSELLGNNSTREESGSRRKTRPNFSEEFISNSPLLVQRRGGFGYTKANNYSPTIRAQTGRHQGGHTDRPILCGQKLNVERVREVNGLPRGMDGRRGRFIGNAVSPLIVEKIGRIVSQISISHAD